MEELLCVISLLEITRTPELGKFLKNRKTFFQVLKAFSALTFARVEQVLEGNEEDPRQGEEDPRFGGANVSSI